MTDFADSYIKQSELALEPIFPFLCDSVVSRTQPRLAGLTVADLGGGTGQWLEALFALGIGFGLLLDENPAMVSHARARFELIGCRGHAIRCRAEAIPICSASCDLAISRNSMHLWADIARGWAEIFRILVPGGSAFIGRGFGPDIPGDVREKVKTARKAIRAKDAACREEPQSPPPLEVVELAKACGFRNVQMVPDGKSYWILAKKNGHAP